MQIDDDSDLIIHDNNKCFVYDLNNIPVGIKKNRSGVRIVKRLSTKIVQINDKSMKLCHNTYDPKTNIF